MATIEHDDLPREAVIEREDTSAAPGGRAALATAAAAAALAACGGGGGGDGGGGGGDAPFVPVVDFPVSDYTHLAAANDTEAARFLQQAQFSSTPEEIAAIRSDGYPLWLARQFQQPRGQSGWDWLEARGYGAVDSNSYFFNHYPADFMIWSQLLVVGHADAQRLRQLPPVA